MIEILPAVQGRGLGTAVMRSILSQAQLDHVPVVLQVLKVNPARRLYERLGFSIIGETATHYLMRTSELVAVKEQDHHQEHNQTPMAQRLLQ